MQKSVLIIGYGSMARRYIKILKKKKYRIFVYQHRKDLKLAGKVYPIISLNNLTGIDYIIITCPTNKHYYYLKQIINFKIPVLVEKPVSDKITKKLLDLIKFARSKHTFIMVGFNLRFLPIVQIIKKLLLQKSFGKILSVNIYAGHYLPFWRPEQSDYSSSYSANYNQGGGVALDLIHEIDLALHWFSKLLGLTITGKKLGTLKTDCEDYVQIISNTKLNLSITLDSLNHIKSRRYLIIGSKASVYCDIYNQVFILKNKNKILQKITDPEYFDMDLSYKKELEYFLMHSKNNFNITSRDLGLDALKIAQKARIYVPRI